MKFILPKNGLHYLPTCGQRHLLNTTDPFWVNLDTFFGYYVPQQLPFINSEHGLLGIKGYTRFC